MSIIVQTNAFQNNAFQTDTTDYGVGSNTLSSFTSSGAGAVISPLSGSQTSVVSVNRKASFDHGRIAGSFRTILRYPSNGDLLCIGAFSGSSESTLTRVSEGGVQAWSVVVSAAPAVLHANGAVIDPVTEDCYIALSDSTTPSTVVLKISSGGFSVWQIRLTDSITPGSSPISPVSMNLFGSNLYLIGLETFTSSRSGAGVSVLSKATGAHQWTNHYDNGAGGNVSPTLGLANNAIDRLGNFYVCLLDNTANKWLLVKVSSTGAVVWTRSITPSLTTMEGQLGYEVDLNGDVYIATSSTTGAPRDSHLLKFDSTGTLQWQRLVSSSGNVARSGWANLLLSDGYLYVTYVSTISNDHYVGKYSCQTGVGTTHITCSNPNSLSLFASAATTDGNLILGGALEYGAAGVKSALLITPYANVSIETYSQTTGTQVLIDSAGSLTVATPTAPTVTAMTFAATVITGTVAIDALSTTPAHVESLITTATGTVGFPAITGTGANTLESFGQIGGDPAAAYVKLLLHFEQAVPVINSVNAGTVFTSSNFSIVTNPLFGTYGGYFNNTSTTLDTPADAAWNLGANDFCIEAAISFASYTKTARQSFVGQGNGLTTNLSWLLSYEGNSGFTFKYTTNGATGQTINFPFLAESGVYYRLAAVRKGTKLALFLDGKLVAVKTIPNDTVYTSTAALKIGYLEAGGTSTFWGTMDEVRLTNGVSRYDPDVCAVTANPHWANTVLYFPFEQPDNTIADVRQHPFTNGTDYLTGVFLTPRNGNKIGNAYAYGSNVAANNGGAYSSATSSDYAFGTGDFTAAGWVNFTSSVAQAPIFSTILSTAAPSTPPYGIKLYYVSNTTLGIFASTGATPGSTDGYTFAIGNINAAWHHIALVREAGVIKLYVDGVSRTLTQVGNGIPNTVSFDTTRFGLCQSPGDAAAAQLFHGGIDDFFVVKAAVYTGNFTPPTTAWVTPNYQLANAAFADSGNTVSGVGGDPTLFGTGSNAVAAFTSSATGTALVSAVGANTVTAFTSVGTGNVSISGTGSNTVTQISAGVGSVPITGTSANATTQVGTGNGIVGSVPIIGTGTNTVTAFTSAASGVAPVSGAGSNASTQISATTGKVFISGTGANTSTQAASGSGAISILGTGSGTTTQSSASTGTVSVRGTGSNTATQSSVGTGSVSISGSGTNTTTQTGVGSGTSVGASIGIGANSTIQSSAGTGLLLVQGTGPSTVTQSSSGTGTALARGTGANTVAGLTSSGSGNAIVSGSGSNTVAAVTSGASGTLLVTGTATNSPSVSSAGTGTNKVSGTGSNTITQASVTTGVIQITGVMIPLTIPSFTGSGSGRVVDSGILGGLIPDDFDTELFVRDASNDAFVTVISTPFNVTTQRDEQAVLVA